jgi:hypothetical protein
MQISEISFPKNSLLSSAFPNFDYSDCFYSRFSSIHQITLENYVQNLIFNSPVWERFLINLRNLLVKPFGLKTGTGQTPEILFHLSKGDKISFFEVIAISEEEVVLCGTDKHLDVCLSMILRKVPNEIVLAKNSRKLQYEVFVTTVVKFKNKFGHIYFFFIKPFHKLIMRNMLIRFIHHFTNSNN